MDKEYQQKVDSYKRDILKHMEHRDFNIKGLYALWGNWGVHDNGPEAIDAFKELGVGVIKDSLDQTVLFISNEQGNVQPFTISNIELQAELNRLEDLMRGRTDEDDPDYMDDDYYDEYDSFKYDPDDDWDSVYWNRF